VAEKSNWSGAPRWRAIHYIMRAPGQREGAVRAVDWARISTAARRIFAWSQTSTPVFQRVSQLLIKHEKK
jgi:hypothetical protein